GLIMMMDVRHPMTVLDEQMLRWCEAQDLRVHILLTKADKLKRGPAKASLFKVEEALKEFSMPATVQLFSATDHTVGLQDALKVLNEWLPRG
ncbi:MAG: ribosome biogenesis GTP-binding protein YihA/YsxC, partial [Wohlfahrtiimonas sp.]